MLPFRKPFSFNFVTSRSANIRYLFALLLFTLAACQSTPTQQTESEDGISAKAKQADHLLTVNCLLPGQIRKLGSGATYITPRRPVKVSASVCEIRGGEYVSLDRANFATALKIWLPLAEEGDPEAQTYVGEIYEKGLGVPPDHLAAAEWYRRAAEQNYSRARINLGYLYERGLGVEKDLTQAINYYRQASGLENNDLQFSSVLQAEHQKQIDEVVSQAQSQLAAQNKQIQQLKQTVQSLQKDLGDRQQQVQLARTDLESLRSQLAQAGANSASADPQLLEKLKQQVELGELKLANQEQQLKLIQTQMALQNSELKVALKSAEQKNQMLKGQVQEKNKEVELVKQQLATISSQLEDTRAQLRETEKQFRVKVQDISIDRGKILAERRALADTLGGELDTLVAQLEASQQQLLQKEKEVNQMLMENQSLRLQSSASQANKVDEIKKLEASLGTAKAELDAIKEKMLAQQNRFDQERQNLEASLSSEQSQQYKAEIQRRDNMIDNLQQRLAQREKEAEFQRLHMQKLMDQASSQSQKVSQLKNADPKQLANAGPIIEIIDPPIYMTRSIPNMKMSSSAMRREVLGKVSAASGLAGFYINDEVHRIEDQGIFRFNVRLSDDEREKTYELVAADKLGQRTQYQFNLIRELEQKNKSVEKVVTRSNTTDNYGNYYALLIGNRDYEQWPDLRTPINDVKAVAQVLEKQYGFKVEVLEDATRYEILSAIHAYNTRLSENDNLLIYYAGHGDLDRINERGHWIPVDGDVDNPTNWISNVAITDMINTLPAKDILIVADSCYSGTLTSASISRMDRQIAPDMKRKYLRILSQARSRVVLTAGGVEPVLDSGGDENHSVFAQAFIKALSSLEEPSEGYRLYVNIATSVNAGSSAVDFDQQPLYAPIQHAGHESGDFVFVPNV